jgi:hypothetical protein
MGCFYPFGAAVLDPAVAGSLTFGSVALVFQAIVRP